MTIAIGSDHGGYELKEKIKDLLKSKNIDFIDVGTRNETESVDYPDYADKLVDLIKEKKVESGILLCGTGIGMSLAANRHKFIRATLCINEFMAEMSRKHNNSNVLVLGARISTYELAERIVNIWLETEFEGKRHQTRIDKIS